jgi:hypothetical protein
MADAVTSQTLVDGKRNVVMKFTNISDATGETAVTKVDVSALSGSPTEVAIERIIASTNGMGVSILWDADTDVPAFVLGANESASEYDFRCFGGLINNAGTGVTGDINFTTIGAGASDTYTIILHMTKRT